MSTPIVEMQGVGRAYRDVGFSLADVHLQISAGESVFIVGKSGSGKSTLLNIMGLLECSDRGSYTLFGKETTTLSVAERAKMRAEHIGFVFQSFHLQMHRTVIENVQLGALYSDTPRSERIERSLEILEALGLESRATAKPATLSGGERQRVAIARALLSNPGLLLCDEPTGNLDEENGKIVMDTFGRAREAGTAVVVVTHDQSYVSQADTVVHISDGRVV